jgi:hypothetical protein
MREYSRYVVVVDNLSSSTPTKDIEYEFGFAGRIRDLARDYKARCALVEYERWVAWVCQQQGLILTDRVRAAGLQRDHRVCVWPCSQLQCASVSRLLCCISTAEPRGLGCRQDRRQWQMVY